MGGIGESIGGAFAAGLRGTGALIGMAEGSGVEADRLETLLVLCEREVGGGPGGGGGNGIPGSQPASLVGDLRPDPSPSIGLTIPKVPVEAALRAPGGRADKGSTEGARRSDCLTISFLFHD